VTNLTTTASGKTKAIAAALAFASALAVAYASFSDRWFSGRDPYTEVRTEMGLRSVESCWAHENGTVDGCESASLSDAAGGESQMPLFGWITTVALWIAALALAGSAALMLAGKFPVRFVAPTTVALVALAFALIAGCVFLALKPRGPLGAGPGFIAWAPGELAGIIATILVARIRPADPEWDDPQPFDEEKWHG
jgi:hypothetical protein